MQRASVRGALSSAIVAATLGLAGAGCSYPGQQSWLGYTTSGETPGWNRAADGRLATQLHGAALIVDLGGSSTRIEVAVDNETGKAIEIRLGAEGTATSLQIGEYLQRPALGGQPSPGSDYLPYRAMQSVKVETGWRATFYLDRPLGRDPVYGQYFIFTVEGRLEGAVERRSLSLVARNPRETTGPRR